MATRPVIDDLDRCKSALQYVAEGQPPVSPRSWSCWSNDSRRSLGRPRPNCANARVRAPPSRGACSPSSQAAG